MPNRSIHVALLRLLLEIEDLERPVPMDTLNMISEPLCLSEDSEAARPFGNGPLGFGVVIVAVFLSPSGGVMMMWHRFFV